MTMVDPGIQDFNQTGSTWFYPFPRFLRTLLEVMVELTLHFLRFRMIFYRNVWWSKGNNSPKSGWDVMLSLPLSGPACVWDPSCDSLQGWLSNIGFRKTYFWGYLHFVYKWSPLGLNHVQMLVNLRLSLFYGSIGTLQKIPRRSLAAQLAVSVDGGISTRNPIVLNLERSCRIDHYLVGGWATPLKNMSSSIGMIIPNIWENKKYSKPPTSIAWQKSRCLLLDTLRYSNMACWTIHHVLQRLSQ